MFETIPRKTAHDLTAILVFVVSAAIRNLRRVAHDLAPHLRAPRGMELRSRDGAIYSGLVIVEANHVTAGFVVLVGPCAPRQDDHRYERAWRDEGLHRSGSGDQLPMPRDCDIDPYQDPQSWPR